MSNSAIARRYASALYGEAVSRDLVDRVDDDTEMLLETMKGSRDLRLLLESPVVNVAKKEAIVVRLFKPHVSDLVLNFLRLVISKRRESALGDIVAAYRSLRLEQKGIVEASARVAVGLTSDEIDDLRAAIAGIVSQEVLLEVEEDQELIGGVVFKIGDIVYDGSLKRKLGLLQDQLLGGSIHNN